MKSVEARFMEKVSIDPNSGCWLWTGALDSDGYGNFRVGSVKDGTRRVVSSYKWAYENYVGMVPEGLELDHLCRVRKCCNPEHLEPVTRSVNQLRGLNGQPALECKNGHVFTDETTYRKTDGKRQCLICRKEKINKWYQKNKARVLARKKERTAQQHEEKAA
jgi:hypothetical protein